VIVRMRVMNCARTDRVLSGRIASLWARHELTRKMVTSRLRRHANDGSTEPCLQICLFAKAYAP
jgi:hypothetical protein